MSAMHYLQNETAGYVGNSPLWWRKGGSGYTTHLDDAEQFTEWAADRIIASTRGTHRWKKWLVEIVDAASHRSFDPQDYAYVSPEDIT